MGILSPEFPSRLPINNVQKPAQPKMRRNAIEEPDVFWMSSRCGMLNSYRCYFCFRKPIEQGCFFSQHGYIISGEFIGIRIGINKSDAIKKIKSDYPKLDVVGPNTNGGCFDIKLHGDQFAQIYDETWRGGTICISFVNDKVTSIAWNFNSFAI